MSWSARAAKPFGRNGWASAAPAELGRRLVAELPRSRRLAGELGWVFAGQIAAVSASLFGVRLVTQVVSPEVYGQVALGMTVSVFVSQSAFGALYSGAIRYYAPAAEEGRIRGFLKALWDLTLIASLVLGGLGIAISLAIGGLAGEVWGWIAFGALIVALAGGWAGELDGLQNAARHRIVVAWHQGIGQWLRVLLVIALVLALGATGPVVMAGYALAAMLTLLSQWLFFRWRLAPAEAAAPPAGERAAWRGRLLRYGAPFALWGLFYWFQTSADRWALEAFQSTADVGLYSVVFGIGAFPMTLAGTMVGTLVGPILFSRAGAGDDDERLVRAVPASYLLTALMVVATLVLAGFTWAFHDFIFGLLVAEQYRSASSLLPLAVLGAGLFNSGQLAAFVPLQFGASRALLFPKIGSGVLGVLFAFAGAAWAGLPGVLLGGIATALAYFVMVVGIAMALHLAAIRRIGHPAGAV